MDSQLSRLLRSAWLSVLQAFAGLLMILAHEALLVWGAFTLANKYFGEEGWDIYKGTISLIPGGGETNIGSGRCPACCH